jgi:poly(A) polymerase
MTARLDPEKILWLAWPETKAVMAALQGKDRGSPVARFVGGAVRDAILGRMVEDIDIATVLAPDEVTRRLKAAGIKAVPTGIDHGTVTAVANGRPFEITTLRHDVETFGRRARVEFTDDWQADAARRDFTINAVYAEAGGGIVDPLGGREDITAGRVRFIGDARARIGEDALRILRFFRFSAWFGRGELDPAGLEACRELAPRLDILSVERVAKEILKLLAAPAPAATLRAMAAAGVLPHVLPEAEHIDRLARLEKIEAALAAVDALRRLAVLLPPAGETGARLRLSRADQARLKQMITPMPEVNPSLNGLSLVEALYRRGREEIADHALLNWAGSTAALDDRLWRGLIGLIREEEVPKFPLQGADVVTRGVPPGPEVGRILAEAEARWIAAGLPESKAAALAFLEQVLEHRATPDPLRSC